mgnify:CR=1 FL=1
MREPEAKKLDPIFTDRWSPRAFKSEPLSPEEIEALFEAAKWAPSCFNEQPWFFKVATEPKTHQKLLEVLVEGNQAWAKNAPVLIAVFSKRNFSKNDSTNRWAAFDTGAAWMSLNLQALKMGLYCHGMGGYDQEKAYTVCEVDPNEYESLCMIAVGKKDSPNALPEKLQQKEKPSERKPLKTVFEFL